MTGATNRPLNRTWQSHDAAGWQMATPARNPHPGESKAGLLDWDILDFRLPIGLEASEPPEARGLARD